MGKLRIAQYGCGKMAKYTMRYVYEKGGEIVAAFDVNPEIIGRDIGEIMGGPARGVKVRDAAEADAVLASLKPDACIITTMSLMRDIRDALLVCARNGVDAITTNEEAIFPMNSSPSLTGEVDALIVQNPYAMGYLGVETAANLINGQTGGPSVIDTATTIVTRENMYERESQKILFSFEERK